jgi:two-component system, chemotaxis family, chemotaxis protein CheY
MKHILVVDDNAINRKLAIALLKKRGWVVQEADSGQAAIACLVDGAFDAVLLDISMPGMDGETVCRHIRADARLAGLRVVAYTAHAMEHEKKKIMDAGFDDIVIKPVTMAALQSAMPD